MESTVKAYGKVLLFGAYSILEPGNIGCVVNVDKGTTTTVQETNSGRIVIDLANFEISVYGTVDGHKIKFNKNSDTLKFIRNAVEYSFEYLNYQGLKIRDIRLMTYNDPELSVDKIKAGFGSSATATVSTVAAVLKLHDIEDIDTVFKISFYSHYRSQENTGSGFDILSACYGSNFFLSKQLDAKNFIDLIESDWKIPMQEFEWPITILPVLIFTGKSASTQELVKKILAYKEKNIAEYKSFMSEYNQVNLLLKKSFQENNIDDVKVLLQKSWSARKQLGKLAKANIEEDSMTNLLENLRDNGAFAAGLAGAGGGDSIIALCDSESNRQGLINYCNKNKLTLIENLNITNQGYEIIV